MKGSPDIVNILNDLLAEELTAISQYMVNSEMCANWGYDRLHKAFEKQAIDEMHHAEWLIARILFLDGSPAVSRLNQMHIGKTVPEMVLFDEQSEAGAIKSYNQAINKALEAEDNGTRELLDKILLDEERHVDWAEQQRNQIEHMGLENYLANQALV